MIYKCIRCHYSTEVKGNYKTHLLRKKPCDPIFSNTSCEELKMQLDDGKYKLPEPTNPNNNDDELQVDIEKLTKKEIILKYKKKIDELNKEIDDICESQEQFVIQEKETYKNRVLAYQEKLQKIDLYIEHKAAQFFEDKFEEMANHYRTKIEKQLKKEVILFFIDKNQSDQITQNISEHLQLACNKGARIINIDTELQKNLEFICSDFLDLINNRDDDAIDKLVNQISINNNQDIEKFYQPPTKDNIVVPPNVGVNEIALEQAYQNNDPDHYPAIIKIIEKGEVLEGDNLPPQYVGKKKIVVQAYDPQNPSKKTRILWSQGCCIISL